MAPPGDRLVWKDSVVKEKEREPYNGYITTTVQPLDKPQYGSWTFFNGKLRIGPIESGSGFIFLCVLWLLFASIPETIMHALCVLMQRIIILFLPLTCLVCVFYWVELLVQKYCKIEVSFSVFPICVVGEVCTQSLVDPSDFLRTTGLFSVLVATSGAVIFSKFKVLPSSLVILLLWIARISCWFTLQSLPASLRPYLAYFSAFSGLVLSRHIQECVAQRPCEIECKAPVIRRRRTSSVSSSSSLNSRTRRTSLPALGVQAKGSVDYTTLGEAHGMITDLLADSNIPPNVASTLKIISTMIAPTTAFHTGQRPFVAQMTPLIERFRDEHQEDKVRDQPDLKDDIHLPMMGRLRRSVASPARRMSSTWTTTTSATGMPTLDVDMQLTRGPSAHAHELSTGNPSSSPSGTPRSPSPLVLGAKAKTETSENSPGKPSSQDFNKHRPSLFTSSFPPPASSPSLLRKSPDRQHPPSPGLILKASDKTTSAFNRKLSDEEIQGVKEAMEKVERQKETMNTDVSEDRTHCSCTCHLNENSSMKENSLTLSSSGSKVEVKDFDLPKVEKLDTILDTITDWNFPIFDACKYGNILCQVSYRVFENVGLFEAFKIPERAFLRFFHTLESGYHNIPYHNCIHAADVLHGVYFLTTQKIPGFYPPGTQKLSNESDSDSDSGITTGGDSCKNESGYGSLMDAIPLLELLALYTAAAMHDYDHPGRTNAFLVATLSEQALLYNDRSVLENHHAASAFSLLLSDPNFKFLCELEPAQFKRFRFLVIECILATDLKRHFDLLSEFNAKMSEDGGGLDWTLEADRLLTVQICIKMADISGPSKRRDLHVTWTERIVEEFYEQGDDEIARGMPVSPYMDRNQPHVEQLQESFINHLVAPLFNSYENAGLIPGEWVDVSNSSTDMESDSEVSDEGNSKDTKGEQHKTKKKRRKRRKMVSELTTNIETNFEYWVKKLKQYQRDKKLAESANTEEKVEQEVMRETPITENIMEEDENVSENSSVVSEPQNSRETEV